jgi:hypothetical protein
LSTNNVRFTFGGTTYVDSEAQGIIDEMYGSPAVWKACSYVEQKKFNTFLTASNSVKMVLLNDLAFHGDDPRNYYTKLDSTLESLNEKCSIIQRKFDKSNGHYLALEDGVELDDVDETEKKRDSYVKRVKNGEKVNLSRSKLEGRVETLRNEIAKLKLPSKPDDLPDINVKELEEKVDQYRRYEKLNAELSQLDNDGEDNVTLEQLEEVRSMENLILTGKTAAKKAGIPYNENLQVVKEQLISFLFTEEENKLALRYEELQKEKKKYITATPAPREVKDPEEPVETDLSSLEDEKVILQQRERDLLSLKQKKILTCPHCNEVSHYHDGTLHKTDNFNIEAVTSELETVTNRVKEITSLINEKNKMHKIANQRYIQELKLRSTYLSEFSAYEKKEDKRVKELEKIENLLLNIPTPNKSSVAQSKYDDARKKLSYIQNITFISSPPVSSSEITRRMLQQTTRQNIINELSLITPDKEASFALKRYKDLKLKNDQYKKAMKIYENKKAELESEIESIVIPELVDVNRLRRLVDKYKKSLSSHQLFIIKNKAREKKTALRVELEEMREKITKLNRLRQLYSETECQGLQVSVVDTINGIVNNVCSSIFHEPMQIELQLFKTVKSTGVTKPQVNFLISYKGGTMNDIKSLSGGEKDRSSLAISLAFNSRNRFPLLLLDECFASLDDDLKETTVSALRENLGCTMLVIMHDGVKGIYDHEINVASLRNPLARTLSSRKKDA